jgi:hypothetical protein
MRLTVGDLPAAVYWRRRAVVLVGIGLVVVIIVYACSGTGSATNGQPPSSPTTLHNVISVEPSGHTTTTPAAAFTLTMSQPSVPASQATASGPCTDSEMLVTASASTGTYTGNGLITFTITLKNTSTRTCTRDVGADPQELRLVDGSGAIVWSSDDCNPNHGHDVRTLAPGQAISFQRNWDGMLTLSGTGQRGCTTSKVRGGEYDLVARLDQIVSTPFKLHVQASG